MEELLQPNADEIEPQQMQQQMQGMQRMRPNIRNTKDTPAKKPVLVYSQMSLPSPVDFLV